MKNLLTITIISAFICAHNVKAADINPDEILKKALETYQKMKSTFTETYSNVEIDKTFPEKDFIFAPPAGTVLKKSLFENIFQKKTGETTE